MAINPLKLDKESTSPDRVRVAFQRIEKWARQLTDIVGGVGFPITVKEVDGAPSVPNVSILQVAKPGSIVDNGGGDVTLSPFPAGAGPCVIVKQPTGEYVALTVPDLTKHHTIVWDKDDAVIKWVPTSSLCP